MRTAPAPAKINLALVVGPVRSDGKHEVMTVLQAVGLADTVTVERAESGIDVHGFDDDTIVAAALRALARAAGVRHGWSVEIAKRIPVAAGLGGGSSDAGTALRLANDALGKPLPPDELASLAAGVGTDVPFFLAGGTQLGTGDGSVLEPLALPLDYVVLLALPRGAVKPSTASVYAAFDERSGAEGFESRLASLAGTLAQVLSARDLYELPPNDLAASPLAEQLRGLGAFRADVSGAGPCVYGLFAERPAAEAAAHALGAGARTWITEPLPSSTR